MRSEEREFVPHGALSAKYFIRACNEGALAPELRR